MEGSPENSKGNFSSEGFLFFILSLQVENLKF